ncbi:MAG: hypothetical protein ACXWCM_03380 [Acidimicrobiales bacterium]
MVGWFDPRLLLQTAFVTGLGMVFGAYADKRDTFPLRDQLRPCDDAPFPDHTTEKEEGTWLDFVADIGDGFGPTYAVARALATPSLTVAGLSEPLPRGELLVMGGDEVYPAASKSRYENQAIGPYTLAAESADPDTATQEGGNPVELVALPGNHDWYDGLTTFLHAFAPGNRFGVWRTYAKRSYWARALPEGWSIFGVDAQLGGWIDSAQLQYFVDLVTEIDEAMAEQAADDPSTSPQAKVIVCWSTPVWLDAQDEPAGLENLDAFQDALGLASRRVAIEVVLTGDLHHYDALRGPARPAVDHRRRRRRLPVPDASPAEGGARPLPRGAGPGRASVASPRVLPEHRGLPEARGQAAARVPVREPIVRAVGRRGGLRPVLGGAGRVDEVEDQLRRRDSHGEPARRA